MRHHEPEPLDAAIDRVIEGMVDAPPLRLDVPFDSRVPIVATGWWAWPAPAPTLLVLVLVVVAAAVWLQRPPGVDGPPLLRSSRLVAEPIGLRGAIVPVRPTVEERAVVSRSVPRNTEVPQPVARVLPPEAPGAPNALAVEALALAPITVPALVLEALDVAELVVTPLVIPATEKE